MSRMKNTSRWVTKNVLCDLSASQNSQTESTNSLSTLAWRTSDSPKGNQWLLVQSNCLTDKTEISMRWKAWRKTGRNSWANKQRHNPHSSGEVRCTWERSSREHSRPIVNQSLILTTTSSRAYDLMESRQSIKTDWSCCHMVNVTLIAKYSSVWRSIIA